MNLKPDVLVIGAGSAGIAAAVAASRKGAKVLILERYSFAGGKATGAEVGTVCGLYKFSKGIESKYISSGFAKEFAERLREKCGSSPQHNPMGLHYLPYHPFSFKILCDELLRENNIEVLFHATACGAVAKNMNISFVDALVFDRHMRFYPKTVIDCSGESIISSLLDLELIEEEKYQAAAQIFTMENCEAQNEATLGMALIRSVAQGIKEEKLDHFFDRVSIVPGSLRGTSVQLKLGLAYEISNSPGKASALEMFARKMVEQLSVFLIKEMESFANAHLGTVAIEAGIRTGRRPVGKYILQEEDVLSCRKFDDAIAIGSWPIELWGQDKRVHMKYFEENNHYTIPARCLQSSLITNLYFAGRAISATEAAIASARVIGTCLQTGYSAGEMAALAISELPK